MKNFLCFLCCAAILLLGLSVPAAAEEGNLLSEADSSLETTAGLSWHPAFSGNASLYKEGRTGSCLRFTGQQNTWSSPGLDLFPYISALPDGEGFFSLRLWVRVTLKTEHQRSMGTLIRLSEPTSFMTHENNEKTQHYVGGERLEAESGRWQPVSISFPVTQKDLSGRQEWLFCLDSVSEDVASIDIDDVVLSRTVTVSDGTGNLIPTLFSSFDGLTSPGQTPWGTLAVESLSITPDGVSNSSCLSATGLSQSWSSPMLDIFRFIDGPGEYSLSVMLRAVSADGAPLESGLSLRLRGNDECPLTKKQGGNFIGDLGQTAAPLPSGKWVRAAGSFAVTEEDLENAHVWNFCFDRTAGITLLQIDNLVLTKGQATLITLDKDGTKSDLFLGDNGNNLVNKATSGMEDITTDAATAWYPLYGGELSLGQPGHSGENCILLTGGSTSLRSPAVNLRPYVQEAGTYTLSVWVAVRCAEDLTGSNLKLLIRSNSPYSFIPQRGSYCYETVADYQGTLKNMEWVQLTAKLEISPEDVASGNDGWQLSLEGVPDGAEAVCLDDLVLCRGDVELGNGSVVLQAAWDGATRTPLFNPVTGAYVIGAVGITAGIVIAVLAWRKRKA